MVDACQSEGSIPQAHGRHPGLTCTRWSRSSEHGILESTRTYDLSTHERKHASGNRNPKEQITLWLRRFGGFLRVSQYDRAASLAREYMRAHAIEVESDASHQSLRCWPAGKPIVGLCLERGQEAV